MIEIFLVGFIMMFVILYTGRASGGKFVKDNEDLFYLLKEPDYDFLLMAKYGDAVYDPDEVFMRRFKIPGIFLGLGLIVFITSFKFIYIVIIFAIAFFLFKMPYLNLKSYYKNHLNEVDSLLPYYLKSLEVLAQHYTIPVALARSIADAPDVFKPGLKRMIAKIEAGDSSVDPYMDFAKEYPVRDSMRMMRLLYRLGLGEQEKKHQQLIAFAESVSSLQLKSRETRYKNRLDKMEKKTMVMLVVTGGGGMVLLLIAMVMLLANVT